MQPAVSRASKWSVKSGEVEWVAFTSPDNSRWVGLWR